MRGIKQKIRDTIAPITKPAVELMPSGYLHPTYADSLSEFGAPRFLPRCGGWILQRRIPDTDLYDAMGSYPLFVCRDSTQIAADLDSLADELVSLFLVTDPLAEYDMSSLSACFSDVFTPFKEHFIVCLDQPWQAFVHPHHRRYARKALKELEIEKVADPLSALKDWTALYQHLIERHHISGISAFSSRSFEKQLSVPGIVVFQAKRESEPVGMLLWYLQDDKAYYHLGAFSALGYELRASFGLFSYAIEYFAQSRLRLLNLGGGAGTATNGSAGLSRFKQGWANESRTAYFCGRIFDPQRYSEIVQMKKVPSTTHFPAYRAGEFQ